MRPFRTEDERLLFGVAKLAFAEGDDRRTIATLERDTVFVAELGGEPAGYVAIEESDSSLRIEQLCVHPAHEEEGIGGQLLDWAEGYAISLGAGRLEIVVEAGNDRAADFYRRRGFIPAGDDVLALVLPQALLSGLLASRSCSRWPSRRPRRRMPGWSARSPRTARCSRPRRRTCGCSSTTRSGRPAATSLSMPGAARCLAGPAHRLAGNDRALVIPLAPRSPARRVQRALARRLQRRPPDQRRPRVRGRSRRAAARADALRRRRDRPAPRCSCGCSSSPGYCSPAAQR